MKKASILLLALFVSLNMMAQKYSLVVGKVEAGSGINSKWAETLRSNIISGLTSSPRLVVVDGKTISGFPSSSADAIVKLREMGNDCLLTAQITSFVGKTESIEGKTWYKTTLEYVVTLTNVSDGSTRGTQKETHYGSSTAGYDEAYTESFRLVSSDMNKLVNTMFRISGEIKALGDTHPKKGVKTLYINLGSDSGVSSGNIFEVFKEVDIAGETISEKIGELKAVDVKSGTLTLCKVTKGGVEIMNAFDNGLKLTVISRPKKDLFGAIDNLLD